MAARRATLKDVAREAGVTTATVSYVINDTPGQSIRPETRERVLAAVAELHYAPNAHARTLRSHNIPCVGVVIRKNLAVPRYSQMVYGIQERLEVEGMSALLLSNVATGRSYCDYVGAYLAGRVGGIIFIGTEDQRPDAQSLSVLDEESAPLVVFNCDVAADSHSTVSLDYAGGARLLAERVLASGCERVLYFRPRVDTTQERLREEGIRAALDGAPEVELLVRDAPIGRNDIEVWDSRYYAFDAKDGIRLTERLIASARSALSEVKDGDAVIASWATWTHYFRKAEPERRIVYAELANNGESWTASNYYTRMPNYEAGEACAEEVLSLMRGGPPTARTLKLTNIVEVSGA